MSDRLFTQEELEDDSQELLTEQKGLIVRCKKQRDVLDKLILALEDYQKTDIVVCDINVDVISMKAKIIKHKEVLDEFIGVI